jgi:hypothetical protein
MIFWFGKKDKTAPDPNDSNTKKRSIDSFGADLNGSTLLEPEDLGKLGGGKSSTKSRFTDDPNFLNTFTSTIPS